MFGGVSTIATTGKSKELEINGQIRDREVRLIGADGAQKGVVSIQAAMRAAEEAGLDLVKIAPQAKPPVCKLLDYGKYRFEQQKKEKEAKKNQKVVEVKETRLSLNIDTNDFNTKVTQSAKFLAAGHKVKASIRFRGREMAHSALGAEVLKRFAAALPQGVVVSPGDAPHICAVSLPGYPSEMLVRELSDRGICVSSGSACHRGKPSHVFAATGRPKVELLGALRVSFSPESTSEEADALVRALVEITSARVSAR